jgi:DNA end-binding protein Ku
VRPKDGRLILNTMVYADEVVQPAEIGGFDALDKVDIAAKELTMATQLIESLTEEFAPEKYRDTYREAVLALIERKAAGHTEVLAPPTAPAAEKVVDLMAALEASVKAAKAARARHPAATAEVIAAKTTTKAAAKKKAPAKRKSA